MRLNKLFKITAVLAVISTFVSCDEDFSEVGGEIINNPSDVELREYEVNAYSQKLTSVQTNNLGGYFLGVNEHPVYGQSVASIVSELRLSTTNPDFGDNVVLDSVVLSIPYFSREVQATGDNDATYILDSIYGSGSFKLSIYETSLLLNDLDPDAGFETRQKYYSDQQAMIENNLVGDPVYVDENFDPSNQPYDSYEVGSNETDTIRNSPALRIKLPVKYFEEKIIAQEETGILSSNSNFKNYLRNFYFKAEANDSEGVQFLLNTNAPNAKIVLYYRSDRPLAEEEIDEDVRGSYTLNLSTGNRINLFEGEYPLDVAAIIDGQSASTGAENLYLKGQEGSFAVIELFPNAEELADLRTQNLLVNEANLNFYVNESIYNGEQPNRLYLYDLTNNTILIDYSLDTSANPANPNTSLTTFSTPLKTGEDENGSFYTLRITSHISNIINEDADNVKLGLVVVPNINSVVARTQQGGIVGSLMSSTRDSIADLTDRIPSATIMTPEGTVLHGNMSSDEDKRLKLNIYYTDFN